MRVTGIVLTVLAVIASAIAVILVREAGSAVPRRSEPPVAAAASPGPSSSAPAHRTRHVLGVVTYNLVQFEKATSIYPSLAVKVVNWGTPFPAAAVLQNHGLGVKTMILLMPRGVSLSGIAAGREDRYLASWAVAERRLGLPVVLSFAPEANGSWYAWGAHHISPVLYRAMWHRVHDVFLRHGARRITWLWQMDVSSGGTEPLRWLWPGRAYVDEVGIDAHFKTPSDSFNSQFAPTVAQVRAITRKPVLIGEVAVNRGPSRARQIASLFAGVRRLHLAGIVWFDVNHGENANYQLADDPPALAAFRKAVRSYR